MHIEISEYLPIIVLRYIRTAILNQGPPLGTKLFQGLMALDKD